MRVLKTFFRLLSISFNLCVIALSIITITMFFKYKPDLTKFIVSVETDIEDFTKTMDNRNLYRRPYDTVILDKDFNKHFEVHTGNYKYNPINEINPLIPKFYTIIEDEDFYNHTGIDFPAIMRSFLSLIKNDGEIIQGGSTITQQVLKNNIIPRDYNIYKRKVIEIFLSPKFEKLYSKDDIMEFYLNSTYYGNGVYGINNASLYYFNKYTSQLNISEIAMLVGMSNAPSKYNPKANEELAIQKRNLVLDKLFNKNVITQEEYAEAVNFKPTYTFHKEAKTIETYPTSYAIHTATEIIMEQKGFEFKYIFNSKQEEQTYQQSYDELYYEIADSIRSGGYVIYTTLDSNLQNLLQQEFNKQVSKTKELQGSATLVNNQTNTICAIVGGRGDTEFNRAYQSFRQSGSAIKPLIYAMAMSTRKYTPDSLYYDKPPTKKGEPKNWDNKYIGKTTFRNAIAKSINSIPYNLLKEQGIGKALDLFSELQFSKLSHLDTHNLSLAIGGFTYGVSSEELTRAYSTIINNGYYKPNQFIFKITDDKGTEIYKSQSYQYPVLDEDIAYLTLDLLKEPLYASNGTGRGYKIPNQHQVGKTGTTNNNKDEWFIGATPYYTLGVYIGYDMPRTIKNTTNAGNIYKSFMTQIHKNKPVIDFTIPSTIDIVNDKPISVPNTNLRKKNEFLNKCNELLTFNVNVSNVETFEKLHKEILDIYDKLPVELKEETQLNNTYQQALDKYNQTDIDAIYEQIELIRLDNQYNELNNILNDNPIIYIDSNLHRKCLQLLDSIKTHSSYDYINSRLQGKLEPQPQQEPQSQEPQEEQSSQVSQQEPLDTQQYQSSQQEPQFQEPQPQEQQEPLGYFIETETTSEEDTIYETYEIQE